MPQYLPHGLGIGQECENDYRTASRRRSPFIGTLADFTTGATTPFSQSGDE
jgi:hypothetical protein